MPGTPSKSKTRLVSKFQGTRKRKCHQAAPPQADTLRVAKRTHAQQPGRPNTRWNRNTNDTQQSVSHSLMILYALFPLCLSRSCHKPYRQKSNTLQVRTVDSTTTNNSISTFFGRLEWSSLSSHLLFRPKSVHVTQSLGEGMKDRIL